ncbi:MAG: hypothetical protein WB041_20695 [Pseudolabrys sp.]
MRALDPRIRDEAQIQNSYGSDPCDASWIAGPVERLEHNAALARHDPAIH